MNAPRTLVIACGALAHELLAITEINGLGNVTVECLPAALHNRPSEIPDAVRARIRARPTRGATTRRQRRRSGRVPTSSTARCTSPTPKPRSSATHFDQIFIGYADCGTGGLLAAGVRRGRRRDARRRALLPVLRDRTPLRRDPGPRDRFLLPHRLPGEHFDRLVWQGLGIDRHPELLPMYFGNYTRLVYLAQTDDPDLVERAEAAAGTTRALTMIIERTGYGELETTWSRSRGRHLMNDDITEPGPESRTRPGRDARAPGDAAQRPSPGRAHPRRRSRGATSPPSSPAEPATTSTRCCCTLGSSTPSIVPPQSPG